MVRFYEEMDSIRNLSRVVSVALVVLGVVRPAETGAQTEIRQLDVTVAID